METRKYRTLGNNPRQMQKRKCSLESGRQLPNFERTTLGLRSWLGRTYSPPKSTERRRHSLSLISARGLQRFATDRHDCYDIIEALLGKQVVDELRQNPFPAQQVRSTHLHSGEFHGPELIMANFMRTYEDPSFRDAHRTMAKVTHSAIVEWLKRRGTFTMPSLKQNRTRPPLGPG